MVGSEDDAVAEDDTLVVTRSYCELDLHLAVVQKSASQMKSARYKRADDVPSEEELS